MGVSREPRIGQRGNLHHNTGISPRWKKVQTSIVIMEPLDNRMFGITQKGIEESWV